jgi:phospholipid-translocating ATPase
MIPQSLKVTSDISKYIMSLFITWDIEIFDPKTDTPAGALNTAICDDLGEIDYIFTDKTGTLTENVMVFKSFVLPGGLIFTESDSSLIEHALKGNENKISEFFKTLVLCNTVFSNINDLGEIHFHSHSPDEDALVSFAKNHGVILQYRDHERIGISILGNLEEYKILQVLEFNSDRKRMSIIVQNIYDESIKMYTKGADDVIFPRIDSFNVPTDAIVYFASNGLRTLCMAGKSLSAETFDTWRTEHYLPASTSLQNRSVQIFSSYDELETDLEYFGTSAIEDALQDGVPECIQSLRDGGIVIWMLTGDKKETAIQIGYSCQLINRQTKTVQPLTTSASTSSLENSVLPSYQQQTLLIDFEEGMDEALRIAQFTNGEKCLIIEGKHVPGLENDLIRFKQLANHCTSVICCRMSPIQKGQIVRFMKSTGKRSLAIGDGGNDVTMIREADVGVGISGKEGLQAVRAADFSIARFKYVFINHTTDM